MQLLHSGWGLRQGALRRSAATVGRERLGRVAQQRGASRLFVAAASKVVLTREHGKNDKLQKALSKHGLECIELPLIEHASGPDRPSLPAVIKAGEYDWITVTSPEAAAVFLEAWAEAGRPEVRTAVVGGGTGEILQQGGVVPQYVSSKATGKTLGAELPKLAGGSNVVLYPASAKASDDLQGSLESSGFTVKRLNTYNTVGVTDVPPSLLASAVTADVVTFGSPSAVKAWVALVGLPRANEKACACIGATSAKACNNIGLKHVFFPESPGIEGWVESVLQALKHQQQLAQPVA